MINALTSWMYDRMVEDTDLDGMLARSVLDPSKAAVYQAVPVPADAKLPYVVISGPVSDEPDDTFDAEYRTPEVDLHAYTARREAGGSSAAPVNDIAERIRALFHRQNFAADITGYRALAIRCSGPIVNDGNNAYGRVVTARCLLTAAT